MLFHDFLRCLVIAAQVGAFTVGVRVGLRRFARQELRLGVLAASSMMLLTLLGVCMAFGAFGLPSLYLGIMVVWLTMAAGVWDLVTKCNRYLAAILEQKGTFALATSLFFGGILSWVSIFHDLPGLPTHHDGIAHGGFLLRTLDSLNPLLNQSLLAFAKEFGEAHFNYYPNGTHALVTMFDAPLTWAGFLLAAPLLKGWMTFVCGSTPVMAWWMTRRLFPAAKPWLPFVVGLFALTFFQYPVWGADSGGFSRIMAQLLYLPVLTYLIVEDDWLDRPGLLALVLIVLPVVLFHVHPQIFGLHGFTVIIALIGKSWRDWRVSDSAPARRRLLVTLLFGGFGLALVGLLLSSTASLDVIAAATAKPQQAVFSVESLIGRWQSYLVGLATQQSKSPTPFDVSLRTVVGLLGFLALLFGWIKRSSKSGCVRIYPLAMQICGLLILLCIYSPSALLLDVGHIFYNDVGRLAEVMFACQVICWAAGLMAIAKVYRILRRRMPHRVTGLALKGVATILAAWLLWDTSSYMRFNRKHMAKFLAFYDSPLRSTTESVADFIRQHTESNAVLIYHSGILDSLEARTGRVGLFTYSECPFGQKTTNCAQRQELYDAYVVELQKVSQTKRPDDDCLNMLSVFDRPVYFVEAASKLPGPHKLPEKLCRNVSVIFEHDGYVMGRYQPGS